MWLLESGLPILITEWYVKGMDSGLPNAVQVNSDLKMPLNTIQKGSGDLLGHFIYRRDFV
jgi:hypothetical protein